MSRARIRTHLRNKCKSLESMFFVSLSKKPKTKSTRIQAHRSADETRARTCVSIVNENARMFISRRRCCRGIVFARAKYVFIFVLIGMALPAEILTRVRRCENNLSSRENNCPTFNCCIGERPNHLAPRDSASKRRMFARSRRISRIPPARPLTG